MSDYIKYWQSRISAARKGDAREAELLLSEFTQLARNGKDANPLLVAYVAKCVQRWSRDQYGRELARDAFYLVEKAPQPSDPRKKKPTKDYGLAIAATSDPKFKRNAQVLAHVYKALASGSTLRKAYEDTAALASVAISEKTVGAIYEKRTVALSVAALAQLSKTERACLEPRTKGRPRKPPKASAKD